MLTVIRNVGRKALDTVASDIRSVGNFVTVHSRALMLGAAMTVAGFGATGLHQEAVELAFDTSAEVTQVLVGETAAASVRDAGQVIGSFDLLSVASADSVTLPDTGADIEGLMGAAITGLGSIVVVAIGGYFAFMLIKLGLRWSRRLAG